MTAVNFQQYTELAHETAEYPEDQAVMYLALGLADEAGEALESAREEPRGAYHWKQEVTDEVGDVFWYTAELSRRVGELDEPAAPGPMDIEKGVESLHEVQTTAAKVCGKVKKALRDDGGEITENRSRDIQRLCALVKIKLEATCHHLGLGPPEYVMGRNLEKLQDRDSRGLIKGDGEGTNRISTA